jgi:hypothetical protein
MSTVVVLCPFTCELISTGIETHAQVLAKLPNIQAVVHCPRCGERHFWTAADAMLTGESVVENVSLPGGPGDDE